MQIIIVNKTKYSTSSIRKILRKALVVWYRTEDKLPFSKLHVTVVSSRSGRFSGRGQINYPGMKIRVPKDKTYSATWGDTFEQAFVFVFYHELNHNLGRYHGSISDHLEVESAAWINSTDLKLEYKVEKKVVVDHKLHRYETALKKSDEWERRLRRAKTMLGKWTKAVRYYETKYAYLKGK